MRRDKIALAAKHALVYDVGIAGVTTDAGEVSGLPFRLVAPKRLDDPLYTARAAIKATGEPDTCCVVSPRGARDRDDLHVLVPLPLFARMTAAFMREERGDGSSAHRR